MRVFARTETITTTRTYVEMDGHEFNRPGVLDLLDELEDSCMVGRVMIDDPRLRAALEVRGVIHTSVRGSSWRADDFEAFRKKLHATRPEPE